MWCCLPRLSRRAGDAPGMLRAGMMLRVLLGAGALWVLGGGSAMAAKAPDWMRAHVADPSPDHDPDAGAVLLADDITLTVEPNGRIHELERRVLRILRPNGVRRATGLVEFNTSATREVSLEGWCIPPEGKEYSVRDRDAEVTALPDVLNGELMGDERAKVLRVPGAAPGSLVGFEIEKEMQPYVLNVEWAFQDTIPVGAASYTLQLPPGWQYKATWINHPAVAPVSVGSNQWRWTVDRVGPVRIERQMPPLSAIAGQLWITLVPPNGQNEGFESWPQLSAWYLGLLHGRADPTPAMDQEVATLTSSVPGVLGKMQALARFVQDDIRYVAIELGIGGYQPHMAGEVFAHRYGDCKDKATLLGAMLKRIGIDSYLVVVNTERGAITKQTPANLDFNHAILAIVLPPGLNDPSLRATAVDSQLGRILLFDPTDPLTPFGSLHGPLQGGFGVLVAPSGGQLIQLPRMPEDAAGITRTAQLTLDAAGALSGDVHETWRGDWAWQERARLNSMTESAARIRPVETDLAGSLSNFQIVKATVGNRGVTSRPLEWNYTIDVDHYAKSAGSLLLVRPRVIGHWSSGLLETDKPRRHPIELDELERDTEQFDIALPAGYTADDLPPPVDADFGFADYHSRTELARGTLRYRRTLEIKQLSVPVEQAADLKKLYRIIDNDERMVAVLQKGAETAARDPAQ
ncbi:MAG: DUF3857 domain-containing transglutaminase family protein [Steroidobacteraceae bacterium]